MRPEFLQRLPIILLGLFCLFLVFRGLFDDDDFGSGSNLVAKLDAMETSHRNALAQIKRDILMKTEEIEEKLKNAGMEDIQSLKEDAGHFDKINKNFQDISDQLTSAKDKLRELQSELEVTEFYKTNAFVRFGSPFSSNSVDLDKAIKVRNAFEHAWKAFSEHCLGSDEYRPGENTCINISETSNHLTLISSLDTMLLMGLDKHYHGAVKYLKSSGFTFRKGQGVWRTKDLSSRLLGGLLSAYHISGDRYLLDLAIELADIILFAFDSPSGLPYSKIYLNGQVVKEDFCTIADLGSFQLEFTYLAHLTKNKYYYEQPLRAYRTLLRSKRHSTGLFFTEYDLATGASLNRNAMASDSPPPPDRQASAKKRAENDGVPGEESKRASGDGASSGLEAEELKSSTPAPTESPAAQSWSVGLQGALIGAGKGKGVIYESLLKFWIATGTQIDPLRHFLYNIVLTRDNLKAMRVPLDEASAYLRDLDGSPDFLSSSAKFSTSSCSNVATLSLMAMHLGPTHAHYNEYQGFANDVGRLCANMHYYMSTRVSCEHVVVDNLTLGEKAHCPTLEQDKQAMAQASLRASATPSLNQGVLGRPSKIMASGRRYALRSEDVEGWFYIYRNIRQPTLQDWAWFAFEGILAQCRMSQGFSTVRVPDDLDEEPGLNMEKENYQPSYFLEETLKYYFLLYTPFSYIDLNKYVFNAAGHLFPQFPLPEGADVFSREKRTCVQYQAVFVDKELNYDPPAPKPTPAPTQQPTAAKKEDEVKSVEDKANPDALSVAKNADSDKKKQQSNSDRGVSVASELEEIEEEESTESPPTVAPTQAETERDASQDEARATSGKSKRKGRLTRTPRGSPYTATTSETSSGAKVEGGRNRNAGRNLVKSELDIQSVPDQGDDASLRTISGLLSGENSGETLGVENSGRPRARVGSESKKGIDKTSQMTDTD